MTSPIVINVPTRELLAEKTKSSFVSCFQHLDKKTMFVNKYLRYLFASLKKIFQQKGWGSKGVGGGKHHRHLSTVTSSSVSCGG